jgi:hypothetical protein
VLEQLNAHMETDDNDNEARIASQYRMLSMTRQMTRTYRPGGALKAPDAEQFKEAIRKEVTDLSIPPRPYAHLRQKMSRQFQGIGRSAPHSSASVRRRAMAHQTSTRPEAQHVETS